MTQTSSTDAMTSDWTDAEREFPAGTRCPEWIGEVGRLRSECPVAYSESFGGFYTLTRHEDVVGAARDFRTYPSRQPFIRLPSMTGIIPGSLNPPEHGVYRRLFSTFFSKPRVEAMTPVLREYAAQMIDALVARGAGDMAREFCQPFPARALAVLLQLGEGAYQELLGQFEAFEETGWDPDVINGVIFKTFSEHIAAVMAKRRADGPIDPESDVLSGAMCMEVDGEPLSDESVIAIGVSLIGAGHATTADALSTMMYRLGCDPYLQARLRAEPHLIPSAVEELLRLDAPLPEVGRDVAADVDLHGTAIPSGALLALNLSAANYDPDVFEHPEACIVERSPNRHLSFGHGPHQCAGAPMARVELAVALEELLARTASFEISGPVQRVPGMLLNGFISLPMTFRAS
ncbi:cytochrome P450 [Nocardioides acrostichi]|uniref:Cytochrome P450 n=1 Tax=Nocardioides acrostichi TaxID=2784339 RepID=A0A930V193_9ACTN|nr:cytochrome P450 [Nocardioides acrostichi]MBF4163542.1 cytochrome P450 [Nocardioides acrostichi]